MINVMIKTEDRDIFNGPVPFDFLGLHLNGIPTFFLKMEHHKNKKGEIIALKMSGTTHTIDLATDFILKKGDKLILEFS